MFPFVSPLQESRELVIHALTVGRTLQYRSVRMVNHDPIQTVCCPKSSLAVITSSDSSSAPGREQDTVGSSQQLCLARRLNIPDLPPCQKWGAFSRQLPCKAKWVFCFG